MTFSRVDMVEGTLNQWDAFEKLLRSLDDSQWTAPTRCEGFEVRDVAGHVVGLVADVAAGTVGQHTPEEQARQRRGGSPAELADELAKSKEALAGLLRALDDTAWKGPSPAPPLTIEEGVEALWYDAYVHADDIRSAIGQESPRGDSVVVSVDHIARVLEQQGWGPATLALEGLKPVDIRGGGRNIEGDPFQFVMVATGRADPGQFGLDETVNIYR